MGIGEQAVGQPVDDPAELLQAVTALSPEDQRDRAKVNAAHASTTKSGRKIDLQIWVLVCFGLVENSSGLI